MLTADFHFSQPPIVILGAARSGTKFLRAMIAANSRMRAVPFDVNYVWKWGNAGMRHDALRLEDFRPPIGRFIRRQLARSAAMRGPSDGRLVEKTVSNTLRIPFVARVLPEARYVALVRDGRDVIESAYRRWQAPPGLGYLLRKCRIFPFLSCAPYAASFAQDALRRWLRPSQHVPIWGPRYQGIAEDVHEHDLFTVCALQWRACMEQYLTDRHVIPAEQFVEVRYEDLVARPEETTVRLATFLGVPPQAMLAFVRDKLVAANVGKHVVLNQSQLATIERIAGDALARLGYSQLAAAPSASTPAQAA